ncbi:MAG: DoxX family protein [Hydrogenophaga sp.]|nr:DoxX family protein [Hydrogenophaga sp.]
MNALQTPFALLARLLMAALFLPAGISKIGGFAGTAGYIGSVGLPLPEVGAALAIAIEVIAPILLIIGFYTRQAALVLAVFTLAATVLFHNYWAMPAEQQFMQSLMFFKNVGVVGGLLAIAAFGAGKLSLDARRAA